MARSRTGSAATLRHGSGSTVHDHRTARAAAARLPRRALDDDEVTWAAQLYEDGLSTVAIARNCGVHPATITRALKRAGVQLRTKGLGGLRC